MSVVEPSDEQATSPLCIRPGIKSFARSDGSVVLDDPSTGNHYRLGPAEYRFFAHLAHTESIASAHSAALKVDSAWNSDTSKQMLKWLCQRRLIESSGHSDDAKNPTLPRQVAQADPLFFRLSFGSIDHWVSGLTTILRPLPARRTWWMACLLLLVALTGLIVNWSDFSAAYTHLISPFGGISLAVAAICLKVVHEIGHCVACQIYGGRVRQCGVLFICGAPLPFVDVSESRRFPSRAARIVVALAGVAAEAAIATCAVLLALILDSPSAFYVAAHLILTFGVSSIVFNLNPLMKFDGYYVLTEVLRSDNLYHLGRTYVNTLLGRALFGKEAPQSSSATPLVKCYGIASFLWRTLAFAAIGCYVIWALEWLGLLLVGWTLLRTFGVPISRALRQKEPHQTGNQGAAPVATFVRFAGILAVGLMVVFLLPIPARTISHALVEYDPPATLRSPTDAFVKKVHVKDNQQVEAGELLITLENIAAVQQQAELEAECGQLELRVRAAKSGQKMRELKQAQTELAASQEQLRHCSTVVESLQIRAPTAGTVSAKHLENLVGAFFAEGEEIAAVGREEAKRLRLFVEPDSVDRYSPGNQVRFLSPTGYAGDAVVESILPRLTRIADQCPLGAHLGGALDVVTEESGEIRFGTPQMSIIARLDSKQSLRTHVGQRVTVSAECNKRLYEWVKDYVWPQG